MLWHQDTYSKPGVLPVNVLYMSGLSSTNNSESHDIAKQFPKMIINIYCRCRSNYQHVVFCFLAEFFCEGWTDMSKKGGGG